MTNIGAVELKTGPMLMQTNSVSPMKSQQQFDGGQRWDRVLNNSNSSQSSSLSVDPTAPDYFTGRPSQAPMRPGEDRDYGI
jgi:hypothetical protein